MGTDPNFAFLKAFFGARIERLRNVRTTGAPYPSRRS